MKQNFEKSLENILKYEGGFTNHPLDKGGATNLGVTLSTLNNFFDEYDYGDLDKDGDIDIDDIKLLDTKEEAAPVYKKYYWDKMNLDDFPSGVDFLMFDFGVNSGPKNAAKILQRSLNKQHFKLLVDGDLGPKTISAMNNSIIEKLCRDMLIERETFYRTIISNNPSQEAFLKGWLNRLSNVAKELKEFI